MLTTELKFIGKSSFVGVCIQVMQRRRVENFADNLVSVNREMYLQDKEANRTCQDEVCD